MAPPKHGGIMRGLVIYAYAVALAPLLLGPLLVRSRYHGRHRR
jgi:hypothetical protein